jgi:hypothetical protein
MYSLTPQAKIDFRSGVHSAWSNIATFVPKFLYAGGGATRS